MSKEFVISDTHFGHKRIIELQNRPFRDCDEMDAAMIGKWNKVVGPTDLVYHLGDFSFGGKERAKEYRKQLNGRIILIRGNHDYDIKQSVELGFEVVTEHYMVMFGICQVLMTHRPFDLPVTHARFRGITLPIALYGHIHTNGLKPSEDGKIDEITGPADCIAAANMGVELWDYTPQPLEDVLNYIWRVQSVVGLDDTKKYFLARGTAAKE